MDQYDPFEPDFENDELALMDVRSFHWEPSFVNAPFFLNTFNSAWEIVGIFKCSKGHCEPLPLLRTCR